MSNPYSPQPAFGPPNQEPPRSGCGCGLPMLLGCLGMGVICLLVCAGGLWYTAHNADKWVAGWGREAMVAAINSSEIPAGEKTEVIAQIDRVVDAYKARKINSGDLQRIIQELEQTPIFAMITMWGLDKSYLEPSGLSDDEKTAGRETINRALRGVYEKKITQAQLNGIMPQPNSMQSQAKVTMQNGKPVVTQNTGPTQQLSDEEVRDLLAKLKKLADDAEISDEPLEIDIGDEVKQAVDAALQAKPAAGP